MNQLMTSNQPLTMSTREIASLLQRQHSNIKISAERLQKSGTIALQETQYQDQQNKQFYKEYLLQKRDCLILVAQNCPEFTAAIVDRWQLLEEAQKLQLPQSFAEALQLAADQARQLELAAPKVEFHDKVVQTNQTYKYQEAGKKLQQRPNKFVAWLREEKYIDGMNNPYQRYINQGLFKMSSGVSDFGHAYTQGRITAKGLSYFTSKLGDTQL